MSFPFYLSPVEGTPNFCLSGKSEKVVLLSTKGSEIRRRAYEWVTDEFAPRLVPGATLNEGEVSGGADSLAVMLRGLGYDVPGELSPPQLVDAIAPTNAIAQGWGGFETKQVPKYQREGASFIAINLSKDTGACVWDDPGTGKTVEVIIAMRQLDPRLVKIVLCPASLKSQWAEEIAKWDPGARVAVLWPEKHRRAKDEQPHDPDWVVAYYLDADRASSVANTTHRQWITIVDEIHNLKGWKTLKLAEVKTVANFSAGVVSMTGSPLYNRPDQLHPILDLTLRGAFGSYGEYARRYCSAVPNPHGGWITGKHVNLAELQERLAYYSFRRTRQDVRAEMPFEVKFQTVWLEPQHDEFAAMADVARSGEKTFAGYESRAAQATVAVKSAAVIEQIKSDVLAGIPSITFTWLRDQANEIAAATKSLCVVGGQDATGRLKRVNDYLAACRSKGVTPSVVGTMGALGEGANLQWSKVANIAWLDFTPDVLRQVVGRIDRYGQDGDMLVRLYMCRRSIDEHYQEILKGKLEEQFRFDGRREKSKADLYDALRPGNVRERLRAIYERELAKEREGAT